MSFAELLIRRCTIQRPTVVDTALGEQEFDYVTIATNVKCEIQNKGGGLNRREVGEFVDGTYRGYFLPTQDVVEKDRIIDDLGVQYEVKFVDPIRSRPGFSGNHLETTLVKPTRLEDTI